MPRHRFVVNPEPVAAEALSQIQQEAADVGLDWALIGGQALLAHGIPRDTLDLDILVPPEALEDFALVLSGRQGWRPLAFDTKKNQYAPSRRVLVLTMQDDPVLMDIGQDRRMIALQYRTLLVELLAAQHPVEQALLDEAQRQMHHGVRIPVAPLGGVLLVKAKAHRPKDLLALEQVAEHIDKAQMDRAVRWARKWDKATTEDLVAIMAAARAIRAPAKQTPAKRRARVP